MTALGTALSGVAPSTGGVPGGGAPSGPAGGGLGGSYPNPTVAPLAMGGDCSGTTAACTVAGLRGRPVLSEVGAPSGLGQVLFWKTTGYGLTGVPASSGYVLTAVSGVPTWAAPADPTFAQVKTALGFASSALDFSGQQLRVIADGTAANHAATVGQAPALGSAGVLVVAGSGSLPVSAAEWAYSYLLLVGTLTGDRTLVLASVPGRRSLIRNGSSGWAAGWLRVTGAGGGSTYLAPGQSKLLWTDADGVLQGEDLSFWRCEVDWSIPIGASGDVSTALVKTPPRLRMSPALITTITPHVGGGEQGLCLGTSAGGEQIMRKSPPGDATYLLGNTAFSLTYTDADDGGAFWLPASQTIYGTHKRLAAVTTAGSYSVEIMGRVLR